MSAIIRLATVSDAEAIHRIYSPIIRDTHISFETTPVTVAELAARINKTLTQFPWLVCDLDGQLAGYAYASAFRTRSAYQWTTETTVYIDPSFQRRGVATALYSSLNAILREQGYCNVVGVIALPNDASIRAHEAIGFRKIGVFKNIGHKNGDWRDTGWWQLELRPVPDSPQPPRPIGSLEQESRFNDLLSSGLFQIRT